MFHFLLLALGVTAFVAFWRITLPVSFIILWLYGIFCVFPLVGISLLVCAPFAAIIWLGDKMGSKLDEYMKAEDY